MTTPKVRVYELSKETGLPAKDLMALLEAEFGVAVKSHSSSIDADVADKLRAHIANGKGKPTAEPDKAPAAKVAPAPADKADKQQDVSPKVTKPAPAAKITVTPEKPKIPPATTAPGIPAGSPEKPSTGGIGKAVSGGPSSTPARMPAVAQVAAATVTVQEKTASAVPQADTLDALEALAARDKEPSYDAVAPTVERQQRPEAHRPTLQQAPDTQKPGRPLATPGREAPAEAPAEVVEIEASMTVAELAQALRKRETELIRHLFMKGVMVTLNQTMQLEDAVALARELGFDARVPEKKSDVDMTLAPELRVRQAKGKHLRHRAPVVSIMGHVDHGKTSLLDAIREARHKIVDTEAGGITQSIGAYTVEKDGHKIVFIDTPGHEAFTAMRMRGAQSTDIAILVVAADDGVMPQTVEAINHAKAARIPIIVAINKIDKADADPDKVLVQLTEHGLNPEKWGGDTITVEVSALQQLGLDDLLEMIVLVSELQELKADSTIPAEGVVIEARLDKGMGPVATVLIQNGTLHVGESILINKVGGRVRALIDDYGQRVKQAGPSTPVEILGLSDVPQSGEFLEVIRNDKEFKRLLQSRQVAERDQRLSKMAAPGLMTDKETQRKDFYLIIKGDTQGSIEALSASILQLATEEVSIHILHAATGDVSEADILLASASNAIILAFNVKEESSAQRIAQDRGIRVRPYDVIYHVLEDMEKLMLGLLSPETEEQEIGVAEVRQLFSFGKTTIAGCYVTEGKITRNSLSRVFRSGKEIFKGALSNLKRFKDDVKEVAAGYECGVSYDKFNDLQPGDLIRAYTLKEIERTSL